VAGKRRGKNSLIDGTGDKKSVTVTWHDTVCSDEL